MTYYGIISWVEAYDNILILYHKPVKIYISGSQLREILNIQPKNV